MQKLSRRIKRRYKKLAAALAGAACLSAAIIHGVPAEVAGPAAKPLGPAEAPIVAQASQENSTAALPDPAGGPGPETGQAKTPPPAPQAEPSASQAAPSPEQARQQADKEVSESGRSIEMTATAYAPGPHDNDQWGSKTHLGTEVRPGVIAVDPRVIPLGSRVIIKYPDGHIERAVAEDTGGAIKGRRIDVAKWTVAEANHFGIKPVKVFVTQTPADRNEPGR